MFSERPHQEHRSARESLLEAVGALRGVRDFRSGGARVEQALRRVSGGSVLSLPLRFERGRYTRTLVYRDARFELLLLAWDAQSRSPIHDHAGQRCWFISLAGRFALDDYRLVSGGRRSGTASLAHTASRTLGPGELDARQADSELHRVGVADGCVAAVSLHVYAAPISSCLVFDERSGRCRRRTLGYDAIAQL